MNRFEQLRFERGLTIRDVQRGAELSYPTLIRLERGGEPTAPVAKKLADFYGITVAGLLGNEPTDDESIAVAS
jgi:transcriptional regulator with XRE-family HTH domain